MKHRDQYAEKNNRNTTWVLEITSVLKIFQEPDDWGTYVLPCKEQNEFRVRRCEVGNENVQSEVPTRRIALNLRSSETLSLEKREQCQCTREI